MKMLHDVTLAYAAIALLQCWEEKERQGAECSLILKHSEGRTTTILNICSQKIHEPKGPGAVPPSSPSSMKAEKKRKKGCKKKCLEAPGEGDGLPPSRIMLVQEYAYEVAVEILSSPDNFDMV